MGGCRGKPLGRVLCPLDTCDPTATIWLAAWVRRPVERPNVRQPPERIKKAGTSSWWMTDHCEPVSSAPRRTGFQECDQRSVRRGPSVICGTNRTSAVSVRSRIPRLTLIWIGQNGSRLPAPIVEKPNSGCLYTWGTGHSQGAKNPDGDGKFSSRWNEVLRDYMKSGCA